MPKMGKFRGYLKAAHFGPTLLITAISFTLSSILWWPGPAYVIAFTVFLGQLIIGWSNDLIDYADDLKHQRQNKPLVAGAITATELKRATLILAPIAIIANLIGPLGIKGGAVYLFGVACGIAYNLYFKFSWASPLPYALACGALPASIFLATDRNPPLWVMAVGALLGVAFHFVNVLKDLQEDRASEIRGLPQRIGRRSSTFVALALAVCAGFIFFTSPVSATFKSTEQVDGLTFVVGGERPVSVYLPAGYESGQSLPLLIDLHGYSGDSASQISYDFLKEAAASKDVIYAAPDGLKDNQNNRFWNASTACCNFNGIATDDSAYLKMVIEQIEAKVAVDAKRIYFFGHSNGHFMSYRFACQNPDMVAGIAGLAGALDIDEKVCGAVKPVNLLHIHGNADQVISYEGGAIFGNQYTSAMSSVNRWAKLADCGKEPTKGAPFDLLASMPGAETTPTIYNCPKKSIELWTIENGAHSPVLDLNFANQILNWLLSKKLQ